MSNRHTKQVAADEHNQLRDVADRVAEIIRSGSQFYLFAHFDPATGQVNVSQNFMNVQQVPVPKSGEDEEKEPAVLNCVVGTIAQPAHLIGALVINLLAQAQERDASTVDMLCQRGAAAIREEAAAKAIMTPEGAGQIVTPGGGGLVDQHGQRIIN